MRLPKKTTFMSPKSMLSPKFIWVAAVVFAIVMLSSCDTPERVLKSNDLDYKIQTAKRWYEKKQYVKCIPVFEELMGLLKGTKSTEDIYYMYCWANYYQGDYLISSYHFNNFTKMHPNSPKAEECAFMAAMSHEKLSPRYSLDQTNTFKAIDMFQNFVNNFPESNRVDSANIEFQKLKKKLEFKAVENAKLYYKTSYYRAASTAFKNLLTDYPDIDNPDNIYFMIVKSYDKYAENSIPGKQAERYRDVAKSYNELKYRFPSSKYLPEAKEMAKASHLKSAQGAYKFAQEQHLDIRPRELQNAIQEIMAQQAIITDEKEKVKAAKMLEKAHYNLFRSALLKAEESAPEQQVKLLEESIKNYYTFVDSYKSSKYIKSAEKMYFTASDKLNKLKKNGQEQKN
ncbi:MAG TPA: outer membrane protein assembly factor BamD [Chitinophagales bacterium]